MNETLWPWAQIGNGGMDKMRSTIIGECNLMRVNAEVAPLDASKDGEIVPEKPPPSGGPAGLEHLQQFPTLRDPRIHVVMCGKVLQPAAMPQRRSIAHTDEHRSQLRQHAVVEESLQRWWEWLPRPRSWMVTWKEFRLLNAACYEELAPDLVLRYDGLAEAAASVDWHAVCKGEAVMNIARFAESMLELADNFAPSNAPSAIAEWLDGLLYRVQNRWRDAAQKELAASNKEEKAAKTGTGTLPFQDNFQWPLPAPEPPRAEKNVQRGHEAFLFGKDLIRTSAFGTITVGKRKEAEHFRAWDGQKYELGMDAGLQETNAGIINRLLVPNPQTSASSVPRRKESPQAQSSSLGQAKEAIKFCSDDLQESSVSAAQMQIELQMNALYSDRSSTRLASLTRPYSSQHPRIKEQGGQDRVRPASSHLPIREHRPVSALRKRRVGGGGFFADDLRKEYGRASQTDLTHTELSMTMRPHSVLRPQVLRPQSALLVAQRPHSAMHVYRSQTMGSPEGCEHEPPQRHRPSTSLGHRAKSTVETQLTRGPQTREHDVQASEELSARSGIHSKNDSAVLRVLERTGSSNSNTSDGQYLSSHGTKGDSVVASQGSFGFQLRPISANFSVRVKRTCVVSSRNLMRQSTQASHGVDKLFVRSLSPANSKMLSPTENREMQLSTTNRETDRVERSESILSCECEAGVTEEKSTLSLDHASMARHAIRTFADETLGERFRQESSATSPVQVALSRGVSITSIGELDEETLRNVRMIYGAGSEVPLPQEPSKQDLRPLDDGMQAQLQLGDILSSRKVWGKHLVVCEDEKQQMRASNSGPPSADQSKITWKVRLRKGSSLPSDSESANLANDAMHQSQGASKAAHDQQFVYPITAAPYRWQHFPDSLPAKVLVRQARPRLRTTRPRGHVQPNRTGFCPAGYAGPAGYVLQGHVTGSNFERSLRLHAEEFEGRFSATAIEDSALQAGRERREELSAAGSGGNCSERDLLQPPDQSEACSETSGVDMHQRSWSSLSDA